MDATAIVFPHDWVAPESSLRFLLSKQPGVDADVRVLDAHALGVRADHFSWLGAPTAVADALAVSVGAPARATPPGS